MNDMVEVKVSELIGAALDWAVAEAEGLEVLFRSIIPGDAWVVRGGNKYQPSTDWSQGGPLIDKYQINFDVYPASPIGWCFAWLRAYQPSPGRTAPSSSRLIAACRAIVDAKLGDTVFVPKELIP